MADYPVTFEVTRPAKFERPQVLIRIVAYFLLSLVLSLVYWALPIVAAIWASQKGSQRFLDEDVRLHADRSLSFRRGHVCAVRGAAFGNAEHRLSLVAADNEHS